MLSVEITSRPQNKILLPHHTLITRAGSSLHKNRPVFDLIIYRKVSISTREYYFFRALFWSILFSKIRVLFEGRVLFKGGY